MNAQFQTKLLQHLAKKNANKGFTLIELLVVVIIIGVLAAIALPNLLGQVGKARESEAKSTVGALNRAQQAYFTEKADFASSTTQLEVPTGNEKYYEIKIPEKAIQYAEGNDNKKNGTRNYEGGVQYDEDNRTFKTIVCRAINSPDYDDALTVGSGVQSAGVDLSCDSGEEVK